MVGMRCSANCQTASPLEQEGGLMLLKVYWVCTS